MIYCTKKILNKLGFINYDNFSPREKYKINNKLYLYIITNNIILLGNNKDIPEYENFEYYNNISNALFKYNFKFLFEELKFNKKYKKLHKHFIKILNNFNNLDSYDNKQIYKFCCTLNISKQDINKLKYILIKQL